MQRNADKCDHCGERFFRLTEKTPIVNRSDGKSFHIGLFFGPDPRPSPSGGYPANQVICSFAYAHDRIGPDNQLVEVVVFHAKETHEEVLRQVEEATDKLAELVESGKMAEHFYIFDKGQLIPGLPK
ncbi:MAG: hypothetical protein WBC04_19485 [Candidatus Acidiferrales bacterium]